MQHISEKIKNLRELRNFTQEYMSKQLRMTQAGYSKLESGKTDITFSQLTEIAKTLDVRVEDLITFDNQKFFHSFNNVKGNNNGFHVKLESGDIVKLYDDKISLMEKLLKTNEAQLERYRERFGEL